MQDTRPLSPSERWFWLIDNISPSNCSGRVRIHGRVTLRQLERAADALLDEYPLLRSGVRDMHGSNPEIAPVPDPEIPVFRLPARASGAWLHALNSEMATPFEVGEGLARIIDVVSREDTSGEYHDIILTISHVIADGRSLMAVLRKLVEYAAAEPDAEPVAKRAPVPPADDLIPQGARGFWRYAYLTLTDQVSGRLRKPRRLGEMSVVPLEERRTRVVHRVLDGARLRALVEDCKKSEVSVHGALAGAVALAIGDTVNPGAPGVAGIGSPVDFRDELDPAPDADEIGIYAPVLAGFVKFGPAESLWKAARSVKQQLDRGVKQRRHLATMSGMRYGTPKTMESARKTIEMVDRRATWNVSVTNLGRVEFPVAVGSWQISDLTFGASNSCVSGLTVAVVTAHDEMALGFCYVDGVLSAGEAEAFADRVLARLEDRPESWA
ncbi:hypothetical protein JK358_15225 [Nocardia sp. 2]|uniref:Phthiocerol/phthiodiolone dimycocerosyl transferase n=1 Tax=Nocardia acididurans TaxID=2802282 RepID=A0ABS1M5A2_9NOCA|nr:hypothetical protein [Nocardia acididurans]MBL1075746.1 hypothetical protein [Nocardia acididurans]